MSGRSTLLHRAGDHISKILVSLLQAKTNQQARRKDIPCPAASCVSTGRTDEGAARELSGGLPARLNRLFKRQRKYSSEGSHRPRGAETLSKKAPGPLASWGFMTRTGFCRGTPSPLEFLPYGDPNFAKVGCRCLRAILLRNRAHRFGLRRLGAPPGIYMVEAR